jgi:hypothetical protein
MVFSESSKNLEIRDKTILSAQCRDSQGAYHQSEIDLNSYITNNDGFLQWRPHGHFRANSKSIRLDGAVLKSMCQRENGTWLSSQLNLDDKISNCNGKLIYAFERAIIKVDGNNAKEVSAYLEDIYAAHKGHVSAQVAEGPDGEYKVKTHTHARAHTHTHTHTYTDTHTRAHTHTHAHYYVAQYAHPYSHAALTVARCGKTQFARF